MSSILYYHYYPGKAVSGTSGTDMSSILYYHYYPGEAVSAIYGTETTLLPLILSRGGSFGDLRHRDVLDKVWGGIKKVAGRVMDLAGDIISKVL
jgi:hypothetical protein